MTIPAGGPVDMAMVNIELGRASGQALALDDSDARRLAGLPAQGSSIDMNSFHGKSWEIVVNITESDHNFPTSKLHEMMVAAGGGKWYQNATYIIIVHPNVQLVSNVTNTACFWLGGAIAGNRVFIENHGHILGRGGSAADGGVGGAAIVADGAVALTVNNVGVIGGGGGRGASFTVSDYGYWNIAGGGGAPFGDGGKGGINHGWHNGNASYDLPGIGESGRATQNGPTHTGGNGGGWGAAGTNGRSSGNGAVHPGSAAGAAIAPANGASVTYANRGDIRGYAP